MGGREGGRQRGREREREREGERERATGSHFSFPTLASESLPAGPPTSFLSSLPLFARLVSLSHPAVDPHPHTSGVKDTDPCPDCLSSMPGRPAADRQRAACGDRERPAADALPPRRRGGMQNLGRSFLHAPDRRACRSGAQRLPPATRCEQPEVAAGGGRPLLPISSSSP